MHTILKKERLSELIWRYRIEAPHIAKKRQAGQFVIVRVESDGERVPLTIADADANEGWIELIVQAAGHTTQKMSQLKEGDVILDLVGPLGHPTEIKKYGRCLCVGGGVGVAALYPIVSALKAAKNEVTTIIGARNQNLLLLETALAKVSDRLLIATDDGSKGQHGFVSDVFKKLQAQGEHFDFAIIVGPVMMMKVTSDLTVAAGIKTLVSLNPIMIDGTGMCGGCRVCVNNEIKFACVDGPEFDASGVDWNTVIQRLNAYHDFEKKHQCQLNGLPNDG
ncbi:MAG: sulfide/dihydroorotate dehydrogenase-like FAD/NAD-binding protein [Pseudomonadota bacterium]